MNTFIVELQSALPADREGNIKASAGKRISAFESSKNSNEIKYELTLACSREMQLLTVSDGFLTYVKLIISNELDETAIEQYMAKHKLLSNIPTFAKAFSNLQFQHFIQLDCTGSEPEEDMLKRLRNLLGPDPRHQVLIGNYTHLNCGYSQWRTYLIAMHHDPTKHDVSNLKHLVDPDLGESMSIVTMPEPGLSGILENLKLSTDAAFVYRCYFQSRHKLLEIACCDAGNEYHIESDLNGCRLVV